MRHEFRSIVVTRVDERGDSRYKKDQVQREIEPGLRPRAHRAVEKIAADMRVLCQRVRTGKHEQRAVQHVVEVEDPRRRRVHDVALEHFDADSAHQNDDQPGGSLANPRADAVDGVQETLNAHAIWPLRAFSGTGIPQKMRPNNKSRARFRPDPIGTRASETLIPRIRSTIRPPEWCFADSVCRQIGFFAFGPK